MPHSAGAGENDLFDPWDLDDVRERIVLPVVTSLIRPRDLQRVHVGWSHGYQPPERSLGVGKSGLLFVDDEPSQKSAPDDELWVLVEAAGSTWYSSIWQLDMADQLETMLDVARHLADHLEDWVCESVYWGEQPIANYVIPGRRK